MDATAAAKPASIGCGRSGVDRICERKSVAIWSASSIPNTLHANSTIACFLLARCFAWREALTIVQPGTLLRCHREAFRLFWRWQSRPGRPRLPETLQRLITGRAQDNPSWGEERIAAEVLLKLGIRAAVRREGPIELVGRLQEVAPARSGRCRCGRSARPRPLYEMTQSNDCLDRLLFAQVLVRPVFRIGLKVVVVKRNIKRMEHTSWKRCRWRRPRR